MIHTGADGGGPVECYVENPHRPTIHARFAPIAENVLLSVPSGALMVGGIEDYRFPNRRSPAPTASIQVPAGDYALRCFVVKDPEQESPAEQRLRETLPAADIRYYDQANSRGCIAGALTLLLFPLLAVVIDWRIALPITVAVFLSFFPLRAWILKRNARYQRLDAIIPRTALEHEDPGFVFELTRVTDVSGLKGMSVKL